MIKDDQDENCWQLNKKKILKNCLKKQKEEKKEQ